MNRRTTEQERERGERKEKLSNWINCVPLNETVKFTQRKCLSLVHFRFTHFFFRRLLSFPIRQPSKLICRFHSIVGQHFIFIYQIFYSNLRCHFISYFFFISHKIEKDNLILAINSIYVFLLTVIYFDGKKEKRSRAVDGTQHRKEKKRFFDFNATDE